MDCMTRIEPLLGIPFEWGGRGPDTYDCWGLVEEALRRLGRTLPVTYMELDQASASARMVDEVASGRWERAQVPDVGDVAVLSTNRVIHHVGLLLPDGVLHTTERRGAVIQRELLLRAVGYQRVEYYRWAG